MAPQHSYHHRFRFFAVVVLLSAYYLAVSSMLGESPTFDEQGFLVRGVAYLRPEDEGRNRSIIVGHPIGLNALSGALPAADDRVRLPIDDPSWQETSFHRPGELFLWEIGNDVGLVMALGRLPTVWLGLLLAVVGSRWAAELAGHWMIGSPDRRRRAASFAAASALLLLAFDPNLLAHMRLATTDLGLAAAAGLSGYLLWRFLRQPDWRSAVAAGLALGLLQNTKFTALLFLPLFGALLLVSAFNHNRLGPGNRRSIATRWAGWIVVIGVAAFASLWATNGFQIGPMPEGFPIGFLSGRILPLSAYFEQLMAILGRLEVSTPAFLLGDYSDQGWWYYFPVAFFLKTPLPTLLLLIGATVVIVRLLFRAQSPRRRDLLPGLAAVLLPAGGYFAAALTTTVNLGYRHLLPILPFLYVTAAVGSAVAAASPPAGRNRWAGPVALGLLGWLALGTLLMHPHYLAFFNVLAGGPQNGWRALVDSNIDWGQDLERLGQWQSTTGNGPVWLSYFGEGRPAYYGIDYRGLDSFPPRLMNPDARPFVPSSPAPGWYAISATNLQGVHFADHDQFAYFRDRQPDAKLGYSLFLYEVAPTGEPADLLLGGLQPDQLAAADVGRLGTNDLEMRWFDPQRALILPPGDEPVWLGLAAATPLADDLPLPSLLPAAALARTDAYTLYRLGDIPSHSEPPLARLTQGGGAIELMAVDVVERRPTHLRIRSVWRQNAAPAPLKIFIHLRDDQNQIIAQWDGLDAAWEGWRNRDTLMQLHDLPLTEDLAPGPYQLFAGLYHPVTMERWSLASGADEVNLGAIVIP